MKILYSDLKKLIPHLKKNPQEIADFLTMAGFMQDDFAEIKSRGRKDFSMSFEVRHNRADCLSVIGLAYEVAAFANLKVKLPVLAKLNYTKSQSIEVANGDFVKRIVAFEITGIKNSPSPRWLVDYLNFYEMNSKNLLVDLSNYVMLLTGYPSHLLDLAKLEGKLVWDLNQKFSQITTLDGTLIELTKKQEIILRDEKKILALAGIVGGKEAELDLDTDKIIAEMAIYDPTIVRQNASNLKISTEAGQRLSKYLDPNGLDYAMKLLVSLIIENCGKDSVTLRRFDYYPQKHQPTKIKFDPEKPSLYAGIKIPATNVLRILKNLRFSLQKKARKFWVVPPTDRMDIIWEEDIIEEVVRLYGFTKIPVDEIPALVVTPDITPTIIPLSEKIRDILTISGYDEILSSPLVQKSIDQQTNYTNWQTISTQNAVNEEFSELRRTLATGLINQWRLFAKKNLEYLNIFEIGKVFGEIKGQYCEQESLGLLSSSRKNQAQNSFSETRLTLEKVLRHLGITEINYRRTEAIPEVANPFAAFSLSVGRSQIGIIYKLKTLNKKSESCFAEINLTRLNELLKRVKPNPATEITGKLISLDINLFLKKKEEITDRIRDLKQKIGKKNLWSLEIKDVFAEKNKLKYTLNITYLNLSDQEAKKKHLAIFRQLTRK